MKVRCKLIEAGIPTINGHVYSEEILKEMVDGAQEKIESKALMGRLGYGNPSKIDLKDVSHLITKLELKNGCLSADVEVLETPRGNLLKLMLEKDDDLTLHPLFMTNNSFDGTVIEDVKLISADICHMKEALGDAQ
tara:strand:+ start:117684 stop:118091 length:408 start_codon:yes stop_codon:yes gene_type:complete